jgi:hypothetical protein
VTQIPTEYSNYSTTRHYSLSCLNFLGGMVRAMLSVSKWAKEKAEKLLFQFSASESYAERLAFITRK